MRMSIREETKELIELILYGDKYCTDIEHILEYLKQINNKAKKLEKYFA